MATLRFLSGPLAGTEHEFEGQLTLGRSDGDLNVDDPEVSRRHVRLTEVADGVAVEDLASSNGTFLYERRLEAESTVRGSALVRIGETTFQLIAPVPGVDRTRVSADVPSGTRASGSSRAAPPTTSNTPAQPTLSSPPGQPTLSSPPAPGPPAAAGPSQVYAPVRPPRPRRGPATRLIAPAALTAAIIVATAIALVVYFATR